MIDRYIKDGAQEKSDYEVVNQELWEFLHSKYGFDYEVRRYWHRGQYKFYSAVEITLKRVPVILVFADKL